MNGVVNILKPPAMSSGQLIGAVRKLFGIKKAGHTGTLDPGAAGVLPVCIGRATKISEYIMDGEKEYIAEATFGTATDTLDSYGSVVRRCGFHAAIDDVQAVLPRFRGDILQKPPMYSALKQHGQPLYKLARDGKDVERKERQVTVHHLELLRGAQNRYLFHVRCSKGTYIRTLVADIAETLQSCGYLSFLLRTKTCGFSIENAYTLDELQSEEARRTALISVERALSFMGGVNLPDHLYSVVDSGTAVDMKRVQLDVPEGADMRVYCKNVLIGVGRRTQDRLTIIKKLNY